MVRGEYCNSADWVTEFRCAKRSDNRSEANVCTASKLHARMLARFLGNSTANRYTFLASGVQLAVLWKFNCQNKLRKAENVFYSANLFLLELLAFSFFLSHLLADCLPDFVRVFLRTYLYNASTCQNIGIFILLGTLFFSKSRFCQNIISYMLIFPFSQNSSLTAWFFDPKSTDLCPVFRLLQTVGNSPRDGEDERVDFKIQKLSAEAYVCSNSELEHIFF